MQILGGGNATRGIVRRVKKNRPGPRTRGQEQFHVVQIRAELVILAKLTGDDAAAAPFDVRAVGREMRAEDEHFITWIQKRFAKELLEQLGPRTDDDVLGLDGQAILSAIILGNGLAESRQS